MPSEMVLLLFISIYSFEKEPAFPFLMLSAN